MANTFVLIAQQPLEFKGRHYEPGDRFVAYALEAAPYQRQRLTVEAPQDEQRAHGANQPRATDVVAPKRRGRPPKPKTPPEAA